MADPQILQYFKYFPLITCFNEGHALREIKKTFSYFGLTAVQNVHCTGKRLNFLNTGKQIVP